MGALEELLAGQRQAPATSPTAAPAASQAAPSAAPPTTGGALEALLATRPAQPGVKPAGAEPAAPSSFRDRVVDPLLSGTADIVDMAWLGLVAAPAAFIGEAGTRIGLAAKDVLDPGAKISRKEASQAGQEVAAQINHALGSPLKNAMRAFGLLSERPSAVESGMQALMTAAERQAGYVEQDTGGRVLKEDVMMGVNALFGALGYKGAKYTATSAADHIRAREGLKWLTKVREDAATRDAATFAAEEAAKRGGNVPPDAATAPGGIPDPPPRPPRPPARTSEEMSAQLRQSAEDHARRVEAEQTAYELMQSGASKEAVEAALAGRDGAAVGAAMDRMRATRARMRDFLEEAPEHPIREDGTFEKGALTSLLHRPSEMGPREMAARDAAAGIKRGPLGEPISIEPAPLKKNAWGGTKLVGVVGATGLGLAALYGSDDKTDDVAAAVAGGAFLLGKGRGITLEAIRAMPDSTPLGAIREQMAYGLSTTEHLPGNRQVHAKSAIAELLRRPEVTQAERTIIQDVLDSVPGAVVTAKQLMAGIKERTGDFELTPVKSEKYADYGLVNLNRPEKSMMGNRAWIPEGATPAEEARLHAEAQAAFDAAPEATTTIYRSPVEVNAGNHFKDPNYFAHDRSFYEGGVKHVVELQSDLVQKVGKTLTPEERTKLQKEALLVNRLGGLADEVYKSVTDSRSTAKDTANALKRYVGGYDPEVQLDVKLRVGQKIWEYIDASPTGQRFYNEIYPFAERGDFDIVYDRAVKVYEDATKLRSIDRSDMSVVSSALEEGFYHEQRRFHLREAEIHTALTQSASFERLTPMFKNWHRRIVREGLADSARKGEPTVRFATAESVKKVEGWPEESTTGAIRERYGPEGRELFEQEYAKQAPRILQEYEARLLKAAGTDPEALAKIPEQKATAEANMAKAKKAGYLFKNPEHAGLFNFYNDEVASFLRRLGGKPVEDAHGNGWIEVPTEGSKQLPAGKRVQQFGLAQKDLLVAISAIGGGPLVAYLLSDEDNKKRNAALVGVGMSLAVFGRSHVQGLGDTASAAVSSAEHGLGLISTRVADMSPALLRQMRDHKRYVLERTNTYLHGIAPFVEELRKVPKALRTQLDAALLTGDPAKIIPLLGRAGSPELVAHFRAVRAQLNEVGGELMQSGKLKELLADYFPRVVIDVPGLLNALGKENRTYIEQLIADATKKTQKEALRDLSPFEVSQIINKALKSEPKGSRPGFLKKRSIEEVTPELAKFYAPASESLVLYMRAVSKEIERARFFGEDLLRHPETGVVMLDESIGNKVRAEMQSGRLTPDQAAEFGSILRSWFGPGERATNRGLQAVKNMAYAGLLGNPIAALSNVADIALSASSHGTLNTIKAMQQVITRDKARATVHDLGLIDHFAEEMLGASRVPVTVFGRQVSTARFLDKSLRFGGFSAVDTFGKNVSIQASRNKLEKLARTEAGIAQLEKKYGRAYEPSEIRQMAADLRSGELTDLVRSVLFSELSDIQPITNLEVPQAYLNHPNWRTLYMLHTWQLKQLDVARREVVKEFRTGSKQQATKNAMRLGLALGLGGAPIMWLNNFLLGRDQEPELIDIPINILKSYGWSQYVLDKARSGHPIEAVLGMAAPPYKMFDDIIRQDPAALQYLPVVGRIYYAHDWFHLLDESGSEKANKKYEAAQRRKEGKE